MKRLKARLVLWMNNVCQRHLISKQFDGYEGSYCVQCEAEKEKSRIDKVGCAIDRLKEEIA
jgi:hypothetical protein